MCALAIDSDLRNWDDSNFAEKIKSRLTEFAGECSGWAVHSIAGLTGPNPFERELIFRYTEIYCQ